MVVQKDQRVGVFVDVQNLYYSGKNLYRSKVNFKNILRDAVRGRKLIRAIAYVIKTEEFKEKTFFDALQAIGFEIRAKELQIFFGGAKKGDWDVGIAMDMIEQAPKLDTMILVSGDGDFQDLALHLRRGFGCRVEAMAFGRSASSRLKLAVHEFMDMDKNAKRYLISAPSTSRPRSTTNTQPKR